ncbi:MAG: DUF695 domain-containing protein [Nocardioides sp.]
MVLFRRRARSTAVDPSIGMWGFWKWWQASGRQEVAAEVSRSVTGTAHAELARRAARIDPLLRWGIVSGLSSRYRLVVSAGGSPERLFLARRWLRKAPASDPVWEYGDRLPAVTNLAGHTVTGDGFAIALDDVTVTTNRRRDWIDVHLHYPGMDSHPPELRARVADRVVDAVVGELDADLFVGRMGYLGSPGTTMAAILRPAVAALRDELCDDAGKPLWTTFSGQANGRPVTAAALVKLTPVIAPQLDHHAGVHVPFVDLAGGGEPSPNALARLEELIRALEERLGRSSLLVAHETARGTRTLHFYVDSTTTAGERIAAAFLGWRQGRVRTTSAADPLWSIVGHLRR